MASTSGGNVREISWSNANGTGYFFGVGGESNTYDLGGLRVDEGGPVDGAGRFIKQFKPMPWSLQAVVSNDMYATLPEFEAAVAITKLVSDTTFTWTNDNGVSYTGVGTVVGDIKLSGDKSTFTLTLMGGGEAKRI